MKEQYLKPDIENKDVQLESVMYDSCLTCCQRGNAPYKFYDNCVGDLGCQKYPTCPLPTKAEYNATHPTVTPAP